MPRRRSPLTAAERSHNLEEWRLVVTHTSGFVRVVDFPGRYEAEAAGKRHSNGSGASWVLQRRAVGPWEPVKSSHSENGSDGAD
jgi:hypothetical protein